MQLEGPQFFMAKKAWQPELGAAGHTAFSRETERHECWRSAGVLLTPFSILDHEMVLHMFKVGLLATLKTPETPCRHAQRCVS